MFSFPSLDPWLICVPGLSDSFLGSRGMTYEVASDAGS
jgi:hypothetical protein